MENQSNQGVLCGGKWITPQNIKEQFGKSREDAAAAFNVSVSTFTRKYKKLGINQWPYPQRKSSRPSCRSNEETSQLLQMEETSSMSSHQRQHQNSDIPLRQAIEDNNMPNSIIDHDVVDHPPPMGAQPSLESVSTQPLNSVSSIEEMKSLFHKLMRLPLVDLSNPEKETSMREVLSVLINNLSLFSGGQAEQVLKLYVNFPVFVHNWKEYSRSLKYSQKSSAETEKSRDLEKNSESLNKELENKEKELRRQLEAVRKEKGEIAEKIIQKSDQTRNLISSAEAIKALPKHLERRAADKLEDLSEQWAKQQSSLVKFPHVIDM